MTSKLIALIALLKFASAINWQDAHDTRWSLGCDFFGNDLTDQQSTGEQCGSRCEANGDCSHFTWTNHNGGTCWMKRGGVNEGMARDKGDQGAVCGYLKSRAGGGGPGPGPVTGPVKHGKSTRYWDCCKPSCSWNGKAAFSSPVKTCAKDGTTVLGINDQSGCNGGPAYTCNNNQPIVIDDNLSYGFAAAKLAGQGEGDWCCACYQLTFTDGPASGKRMVVQVTNTGGDLGENHFDLQIPGGGVGIFNGCQSQWGAPGEGWGQRYGGVSNEGECGQLPGQLQDGCRWRFGWFRGSDNPSFSFQKVGCPQQLLDRSGCRRNDE